MSRAFWLFLAAVSISFFALNQLLDSPPAQRDRPVRADESGQSKPEALKIEETEDPMLSEQLVESLRNPGHISGAAPPLSAPINPKHSMEKAKGASSAQAAGSSAPYKLPDSEDEKSPDETVPDESEEEETLPEQDPTEELVTEDELPGSEAEETPDDTSSDESEGEEALPEEDPTEELVTEDELPGSEAEETPDDTSSDEPEEEEALSE